MLKELGEVLKVDRRADDTVESYARRVEEAMGLDAVRDRLARRNKPIELA
jgi:hypothetical protein